MKKLLMVLGCFVAAILLFAAFASKDFMIEKEVVINKPREQVFAYLKTVKNDEQWNPWIKKDPKIVITYKGTDGTVGFVSSWSGNSEVGVGEEEIINITKNERIDLELRFKAPMQATNKAYFTTEALDKNQTKVRWGMSGSTSWPQNILCLLMRDKVSQEFQKGLDDLKVILEK